MKLAVLLSLILFTTSSLAGGWSNYAVPTKIDIERHNGFMLYGDFGNAGGCTVENRIFVANDHPQYQIIYSTALSAFMSGKRIRAYIHTCEPNGWYSVSSVTYNTLSSVGVLSIIH